MTEICFGNFAVLRHFVEWKELAPLVVSCWFHVAQYDEFPTMRIAAAKAILMYGRMADLKRLYALLSRLRAFESDQTLVQ